MIDIHTHTFFLIFFSILVYHRMLDIVPCAVTAGLCLSIQYILVGICLSQTPNPSLPNLPPLGSHKFVLYVWKSVSVSEMCWFVLYFRFHMLVISWGICSLSDFVYMMHRWFFIPLTDQGPLKLGGFYLVNNFRDWPRSLRLSQTFYHPELSFFGL